jgi:hypothetical protein
LLLLHCHSIVVSELIAGLVLPHLQIQKLVTSLLDQLCLPRPSLIRQRPLFVFSVSQFTPICNQQGKNDGA